MNPDPTSRARLSDPRKSAAVMVAVAVLVAAMGVARWLPSLGKSQSARSAGPEDCVTRMVLAEKNGDVEAYLDSFSGPLREQFQSRMADRSRERLASELRNRAAELTGHATTDLEITDDRQATLLLERIYRNHNASQRVSLERVAGVWKIVELGTPESFAPEIPYGTPVVPGLGDESQPTEESPP